MGERFALLQELTNEQKYIDFVENKEIFTTSMRNEIFKIFKFSSYEDRLQYWEKFIGTLPATNGPLMSELSNPYYIGYGNPEADILILGQEKAFDPNKDHKLLFHESISNQFQWNWIINNKLFGNEKSNLTFDPRFPRAFFNGDFKKNHTWYKYSMLVAEFIGEKNYTRLLSKEATGTNSLFANCFISEINYLPSKNNKGLKLKSIRETMLSHSFFKKFKYVIVAAGSAIKSKEAEIINNIFEADKINPEGIVLGSYGNNKKRRVNIYKSKEQIICACSQLSGSATWKNEHIKAIGPLMVRLFMNLNSKPISEKDALNEAVDVLRSG